MSIKLAFSCSNYTASDIFNPGMLMRCICFLLMLFVPHYSFGVEFKVLEESLCKTKHPFSYDLHLTAIPGNGPDEDVLVACHGYGGNYSIADVINSYQTVPQHLIGFNFPDHDILEKGFDSSKICFGSIQELLPVFHILKKVVIDASAERVSLYGFSCGGGAVINVIAVLNSHYYDEQLKRIGVDTYAKEKILAAIQKGIILLDAPLKSMDEILATSGYHKETRILADRYKSNQMRPIDSLAKWQGLNLSVIVFFQNPDESVCNRDDDLFIQRLKQYNSQGRNVVLIRNEDGHCGFHDSLWKAFRKEGSQKTEDSRKM